MKRGFFSKTLDYDKDIERSLLKSIVQLKKITKNSKKDSANLAIKLLKDYRFKLKFLKTRKEYFFHYKNAYVFVGDENTPKKLLMVNAKSDEFIKKLKQYRLMSKFIPVTNKYYEFSGVDALIKKQGLCGVEPGSVYKIYKQSRRSIVTKLKKPVTNDDYVGIELEYASNLEHSDIIDLVIENKLTDKVRVMNDSSIRTNDNYPNSVELCILTKFSELSDTISKLKKIIKPIDFEANSSCGLHVHLDARKEMYKVEKMFSNLVSMQNLLYGLSSPARHTNSYCIPVTDRKFSMATENHYNAISKYSYFKHKTIEVRIHESTVDLDLVEKWVRLLKTISDYGGDDLDIKNFSLTMDDFQCKIKPPADILEYVMKNIKEVDVVKQKVNTSPFTAQENPFDRLYISPESYRSYQYATVTFGGGGSSNEQ